MDTNKEAQEKAIADHESKCDITLIDFSFKGEGLPEVLVKEIGHLLHLAGHVLKDGGEVPLLYVGMDAEGNGHLIDPEGIPVRPMIKTLVRRVVAQMNAVAVLMISEGWTVPDAVMKDWAEGNRPEDMQIKDHPEAFEVLMMSVETLNGTWGARAAVSKFTDDGAERTVGELVFEKVTTVYGALQNMLAANIPEDDKEHPVMALLAEMMGRFVNTPTNVEDGEEGSDTAANDTDDKEGTEKVVIIAAGF